MGGQRAEDERDVGGVDLDGTVNFSDTDGAGGTFEVEEVARDGGLGEGETVRVVVPDAEAETASAAKAAAEPEDFPADLTDPQILGRRLSLARQHAGLSVEDVAARTRIRGTLIREIEAGDFSRCGGEVYVRGHVRAIGKAVGVDPEPLLLAHPPLFNPDAARPAPPAATGPAAAPASATAGTPVAVPTSAARDAASRFAGRAHSRVIRAAQPAPATTEVAAAAVAPACRPATLPPKLRKAKAGTIDRQPKSANWTAAMLVALLGLVVFAGVQLIGGGDGKPAAAAAPASAAPPPKPAAAPAAPAAPAPDPAPSPTGVAVRIAAVDTASWLNVTSSDGKTLYDALLPAGSVQTFQDAKQLGVTVGNAAAIRMNLNGKDVAPSGANGAVVHMTLNPTGVVTS